MKTRILLALGVIVLSAFTSADSNKTKALSANTIKFFGVNYSEFKCIHKIDFVDKIGNTQCQSLVATYFNEWNEYFLTEKDKFDLKKYFVVNSADIDLSQSLEVGKNYSIDSCVIEDEMYTISHDKIKSIVKSYKNEKATGVGILIIGESINKQKSKGTYYVTYLDIATGELLYSTKISGESSGYGFAPYWVNSLHDALSKNSSTIKNERKNLGITPKSNW